MGVFDIDLTSPRRAKAAGMVAFAALFVVLAVVLAVASSRPAGLWLAAGAAPFTVAALLWMWADRVDRRARERGEAVSTRGDPDPL